MRLATSTDTFFGPTVSGCVLQDSTRSLSHVGSAQGRPPISTVASVAYGPKFMPCSVMACPSRASGGVATTDTTTGASYLNRVVGVGTLTLPETVTTISLLSPMPGGSAHTIMLWSCDCTGHSRPPTVTATACDEDGPNDAPVMRSVLGGSACVGKHPGYTVLVTSADDARLPLPALTPDARTTRGTGAQLANVGSVVPTLATDGGSYVNPSAPGALAWPAMFTPTRNPRPEPSGMRNTMCVWLCTTKSASGTTTGATPASVGDSTTELLERPRFVPTTVMFTGTPAGVRPDVGPDTGDTLASVGAAYVYE